jgi:hypothetical protein
LGSQLLGGFLPQIEPLTLPIVSDSGFPQLPPVVAQSTQSHGVDRAVTVKFELNARLFQVEQNCTDEPIGDRYPQKIPAKGGGCQMPLPQKPNFPIRRNTNGTYESICTACLATVATAQHEWELGRHESSHVCEPMSLYRVSHGLLPSPRADQ